MTTEQNGALEVVAFGYANTRPTGEKHSLMMVKLDNTGDQYPELATPLVRLTDAQSALESERQAHAAEIAGLRADAARYRLLRRGQHWSVIDGMGYTLRAEQIDAAIDQAIARGKT